MPDGWPVLTRSPTGPHSTGSLSSPPADSISHSPLPGHLLRKCYQENGLKNYLSSSSCRRIQAWHKDSVKVIVKFIRKGYTFTRLKTGCLYSEIDSGLNVAIFIEKLLTLILFGSWDDFLSLGHFLLKKEIEYSTISCCK
jgi:hypothetical protein